MARDIIFGFKLTPSPPPPQCSPEGQEISSEAIIHYEVPSSTSKNHCNVIFGKYMNEHGDVSLLEKRD